MKNKQNDENITAKERYPYDENWHNILVPRMYDNPVANKEKFFQERKKNQKILTERQKVERELGVKLRPYRLAISESPGEVKEEDIIKVAQEELGHLGKITVHEYYIDKTPYYEHCKYDDQFGHSYIALTLVTLLYYEQ